MTEILHYTAFTDSPEGGNPAGVLLTADALDRTARQAVAADLGYSETAFLSDRDEENHRATLRFFAPLAEVDFCGHATIATAVALADADPTVGAEVTWEFSTAAGVIPVTIARLDGRVRATLVSVPPRVSEISPEDTTELLEALGLGAEDLDPELPIRESFAGNRHPIVPVTATALAALDHDHDRLGALMARVGWRATTVVLTRQDSTTFQMRNPFPPGGVREDPATGSAAAAVGGYLRAIGAVTAPVDLVMYQGAEIGRPSVLQVHVPTAGGISVSGGAIALRPSTVVGS